MLAHSCPDGGVLAFSPPDVDSISGTDHNFREK
jgi:hypothetical protein